MFQALLERHPKLTNLIFRICRTLRFGDVHEGRQGEGAVGDDADTVGGCTVADTPQVDCGNPTVCTVQRGGGKKMGELKGDTAVESKVRCTLQEQ